jgi:hypothetical protein
LSVPVWGTTLSGPRPVVGLVSRYLTNYLMGRSPLPQPRKFPYAFLKNASSCGISSPFELLSPAEGQVSYVLRTRSPLGVLLHPVRLACIRHTASVHPEPGSNSPSIVPTCVGTRQHTVVLPGSFLTTRSLLRAFCYLLLCFSITIQLLRCPRQQKTGRVSLPAPDDSSALEYSSPPPFCPCCLLSLRRVCAFRRLLTL